MEGNLRGRGEDVSLSGKFYFRPSPGELVRAEYTPQREEQAILCGRLSDGDGGAVAGAAVLLFVDAMEVPELVGRTVTDSDGQFLFGPLECGQLYVVKVFQNALEERHLELRCV